MLIRLGQGMNVSGQITTPPILPFTTAMDFTSTLPDGFTYSRSDAVSMYRDSGGDWQIASANQPPFDHDENGNPLGLQIAPTSTNKCENVNWGMTDLTGLSTGGNASAVISIGTHPVHGFPVLTIDNTQGGSGTAYVNVSGSADNTNPHSASVYFHVETGLNGGAGCWLNNNWGNFTTTGDGSATGEDGRIIRENMVWNASNVLRLNAGFNHKVHFWLNQLEEQIFVTPPIYVNGASATRNSHTLVCTDLETYIPAFNASQGTAVLNAIWDHPEWSASSDQYGFIFSEGTSLDNTLAMRLESGTGSQTRPNVRVAGVSKTNNDVGQRPIEGKRFPMALSWQSDNAHSVAGAFRDRNDALTGLPTGINRVYIGGRPFNERMSGWVKSLKVYNQALETAQLASDFFPSGTSQNGILCAGQSLMQYRFRATGASGTPTYKNEGEAAMVGIMDAYRTSDENWAINAASDGSSLVGSSGTNYWLESSDLSDGPLMIAAKEKIDLFGAANIEAIDWDQGESNSSASKTDFKLWTMTVLDELRDYISANGGASVPCFITLIGRRSDLENGDYNTVREAQREMISENAYVHKQPEKIIWDLQDGVHLTGEGFGEHGLRCARKIYDVLGEAVSGGVDGPAITNVSRASTTVTVTITHDGGSDIAAPAGSDYEGFKFLDDGVVIPITAAVRTNATTITLTLDSAPSGVEEFYYVYATIYESGTTDPDNLVRDNDSIPMPLQSHYEVL